MCRSVFPWLAACGVAATLLYFDKRSAARHLRTANRDDELPDPSLRNAGLRFRSIGGSGERYPDWVRALRGKSGVYLIRERQRDGSDPIVYIGESHTGRLYQTLTRHFQTWRRDKKFWSGQYTGSTSHDPGLTYDREPCTVAVRILPAARAIDEEARLIGRLRPRDNLIGQPEDSLADDVPF
jgi:hypothetical protein